MAFLAVGVILLSAAAWALRISERQERYLELQNIFKERVLADISKINLILQKGILPLAEVRLNAVESDLRYLQKQINDCQRKPGDKR